ncbi:MAG: hypothetical protein O2826_05715 [Chloroflexi bacterium]|nr:hypothetical protein [Chloroflexota bacterium]
MEIHSGRPFSAAFLFDYSSEHLCYEVEMFFEIGSALKRPAAERAMFINNALVESFVIHLRNLVDFLYMDRPRPTDIVANDYTTGGNWNEQRPPISENLEIAGRRADKEIAHLTTNRITGATAAKAWDVGGIMDEIRALLHRFVAVADPQRLSGQVARVIR